MLRASGRHHCLDLHQSVWQTPLSGHASSTAALSALLAACPQDAAGQLRKSPHQFSGIGSQSPLLWLARGYAVLDGPTMPIVAEGEDEGAEPNDTYIAQLVASARAAVEARTSLLHAHRTENAGVVSNGR